MTKAVAPAGCHRRRADAAGHPGGAGATATSHVEPHRRPMVRVGQRVQVPPTLLSVCAVLWLAVCTVPPWLSIAW